MEQLSVRREAEPDDLLNETAPFFFSIVHEVLFEDTVPELVKTAKKSASRVVPTY